MPSVRTCKNCGDPLEITEKTTSRKKYCGAKCRQQARRSVKSARSRGGQSRAVPDHIKVMKELVNYHTGDDGSADLPLDALREIYRDAVRENITAHVRDSVLGAVEIMTGMLPKALAALAIDLDSHDAYERQRAYNVLFKWVMPLMDKDGKDEDLGQLTLVHKIPVTDTPVGERFVDEIEKREVVRPDDITYPECYICKEHKHPDALRKHDESNGKIRQICQSCYARKKYGQGMDGAGLADLDIDLRFA